MADKFSRSLTIEKIVNTAIPISVLKQHVSPNEIKLALDSELTRFVASLNLKWTLNDYQIKGIVEDLLYKYPNESLEDFVLVFRRARLGEFKDENGNSTIYRLDSAVIFGWMGQYFDQKYEVLERNLMRERDTIHNSYHKAEKDYLQVWKESIELLDAEDRKNGRVPSAPKTDILRNNLNRMTDEEALREGQVKPKHKPYPESPPEFKKTAELKMQYGRECRDIYSGKLKPGMPEFEQWLEEWILNNQGDQLKDTQQL